MPDNNSTIAQRKFKKRSNQSGHKRRILKGIFIWMAENVLTILAVICVGILIYVTVLFLTFNKDDNASIYSPDMPFHDSNVTIVRNTD